MINLNKLSKKQKLAVGILFDAIGMVTFLDILWAPASAYLMTKMYEGRKGRIWGTISFLEEILPGFDIIPTFTLMWIYTYVYKAKKEMKPELVKIEH